MWELKNPEGPRILRFGKIAETRRCPICGQYFSRGEQYYLIVCNAIPEARSEGLENLIVHTHCWETFCAGITSDASLASKLKKHRKPKPRPLTEEQNRHVEAFKTAAYQHNFKSLPNTRDGRVKAERLGTTMSLIYNPYTDVISYHDRRKYELFKPLFDRQLETNVYNKMQELLGTDKRDDYSVEKVFSDVVNSVNKMFNA